VGTGGGLFDFIASYPFIEQWRPDTQRFGPVSEIEQPFRQGVDILDV